MIWCEMILYLFEQLLKWYGHILTYLWSSILMGVWETVTISQSFFFYVKRFTKWQIAVLQVKKLLQTIGLGN